jgi:hypothetical protein
LTAAAIVALFALTIALLLGLG